MLLQRELFSIPVYAPSLDTSQYSQNNSHPKHTQKEDEAWLSYATSVLKMVVMVNVLKAVDQLQQTVPAGHSRCTLLFGRFDISRNHSSN